MLTFKLLMVGEEDVGKSSILRQLEQKFNSAGKTTNTTVGVPLEVVRIGTDEVVFQVWKIEALKEFRSLFGLFTKNLAGIIFVFDLTRKETLYGLEKWFALLEEKNIKYKPLLVANKADLDFWREVSQEEMIAFMKKHNIELVVETSAIDGKNLDDIINYFLGAFGIKKFII